MGVETRDRSGPPATLLLVASLREALGLSSTVNEMLRDASSRGDVVDAIDFQGGYEPGGRYRVEGERIRVSVSVRQRLPALDLDGGAS